LISKKNIALEDWIKILEHSKDKLKSSKEHTFTRPIVTSVSERVPEG
jgi:hypothetical protein